jgi:hypothetical protein
VTNDFLIITGEKIAKGLIGSKLEL